MKNKQNYLTVLTDGQKKAVMVALENFSQRDRSAFNLMINAGLRVGELVGLDVGDVLDGGQIKDVLTVRAEIAKRNKERDIPLNSKAKAAIKSILDSRNSGPLFLSRNSNDNGRLTTRQVERIIDKVGAAVGIKLHPHTLRHTFATDLMNKKVPMKVIQTLLGHSSITTTINIYCHVSNVDMAAAVSALE
jgi:site-specific recombinase XerD